MSSIDLGAKITGYEAKEWIRNILGCTGYEWGDEEDFMTLLVKHKPVDFKAPRKSRASKSSSDRSEAEYDCQLCDARVWNKSLGGQCSNKKAEDDCFCGTHNQQASGQSDGLLKGHRHGLITDPRPVHAYGDDTQEFLKWHDVELPDKPVKKTSSGAPKGDSRPGQLLKENKVEEVKIVLDEIVDEIVDTPAHTPAHTPAELAAATEERRRRWNRVCTRSVKLGKTQERTTERKTEQITFANGKTLDIDLG